MLLLRGTRQFFHKVSLFPCALVHTTRTPASKDASKNPVTPTPKKPTVIKSSAFTGKADFYETLFFLQDVLKKAQSVSKATPTTTSSTPPWYPHEAMSNTLGFALTALEYRKIRIMLNELAAYMHVPEVLTFLDVFSTKRLVKGSEFSEDGEGETKMQLMKQSPNMGSLDKKTGVAVSVGRRKTASAKVHLSKGDGTCSVDGMPLIQYFPTMYPIFTVAEPFRRAKCFGKYNVVCMTTGGGLMGKAGAICQAIAKAICLIDPTKRSILRSLIFRDARMVERKKPGQPKARKKFTWVKR